MPCAVNADGMDPMITSTMAPTNSTITSVACWEKQHQKNMEQRRKGLDAASRRRADALATECRSRLMESIKKISRKSNSDSRKLGLLLSGGVDSSAILQAAALSNVQLDAAITVVIVDPSDKDASRPPPDDELYAIEAARLYNEFDNTIAQKMKHSIVRLTPAHLIKEYTRPTIKTLALWGYRRLAILSSSVLPSMRLPNLGLPISSLVIMLTSYLVDHMIVTLTKSTVMIMRLGRISVTAWQSCHL